MSAVRKGSSVSFPVGRGFGQGTVMSLEDGMATIRTVKGREINRHVDRLAPLEKPKERAKTNKTDDAE